MKDLQKTLKESTTIRGIEAFGGNDVNVTLRPADPNTGIVFELPNGTIPADIKYVQTSGPFNFTFLLKKKNSELLCAEHILATTYAMGIDNARIQIERSSSKSLKLMEHLYLATKKQAIPYFPPENEKNFYEAIEKTGLIEQPAQRKILRLEEKIENERLIIEPIDSNDLIITANTNYKKIGEQTATLTITPENYKAISNARAYMKVIPHWAPENLVKFLGGIFFYPHHGLKSGMSNKINFRQTRTKEQWENQERMPNEIAYHTIIDKLGALALLPGKLQGAHLTSKFSGHKNDIQTLKENLYKFKQQ